MKRTPTLDRELTSSLVVVFAGAVVVAATGVLLLSPLLRTPAQAAGYVGVLIAAVVAVFALYGRYLIRRTVAEPLERVVAEVETIASGDYAHRLQSADTEEVRRLGEAVNDMAERLISHQSELVANLQSLQETNRELTEARDELIRVEKMASVGRLAAGIAHEVGNPLGAILGYVGLLGRSAGGREAELLAAAEGEARRIDRIIHGLLDYARPREAKRRSVDVNEVVERTIELVALQGKLGGVELETSLADGLPPVWADWNQLQQVLVNLMINALDAMEARDDAALRIGTALTLHVPGPAPAARRHDDPPDVDYSHRRRFNRTPRIPRDDPFPGPTEVVGITVTDSGPGVPPEARDEIFEPFFTTKEPGRGTGLGLAVVARLVDAMGGTVRVEEPEGPGARFVVLLPTESAARALDTEVRA